MFLGKLLLLLLRPRARTIIDSQYLIAMERIICRRMTVDDLLQFCERECPLHLALKHLLPVQLYRLIPHLLLIEI